MNTIKTADLTPEQKLAADFMVAAWDASEAAKGETEGSVLVAATVASDGSVIGVLSA